MFQIQKPVCFSFEVVGFGDFFIQYSPFNKEGDGYHLIRIWEWNLYLWVNGNAFWVGSALGSEFCVTSGVALSSSVPLILSGVKGD